MHRTLLWPAILLVACKQHTPPPAPEPEPAPKTSCLTAGASSSSASGELPTCASRADVDRLHCQRVRVEAIYDVDPILGRKGQPAHLILPDGTMLIREYRPVVAELGFVDKRVVAIGTVARDADQSADVQQMLGPHFSPERIELAPGESPYPVTPTSRPPPPRVSTEEALARRRGLWVQVVGRLGSITPEPDSSSWASAEITVDGGMRVAASSVPLGIWERHRGVEITVVGKVARSGPPVLEGAVICKDGTMPCRFTH